MKSNDKNNIAIEFIVVIAVIIILVVLAKIGSYQAQRRKEELQEHSNDIHQEYQNNVQQNLSKLTLNPLEPNETSASVEFSVYVRNKSGDSIGNVYFILTLYDSNHNQIYKTYTSELLGERYYYIIKITVDKKDCILYSTYEWEISAQKPLV